MHGVTKCKIPAQQSNADWSSLPDELLELVLWRLEVADYVRFGAVCRGWNRVFVEKRCLPGPEKPWLWVRDSGADGFYCMAERRRYRRLHLPDFLTGWICCGSQHGWLIFIAAASERSRAPLLVNPFSGAQIQLPELLRPTGGDKFYCSLPPDDPRCIVVYISHLSAVMGVCSPKSNWVTCNEAGVGILYRSAIFYRESLYAATEIGELCFVELPSREPNAPPITVRTVLAPPREDVSENPYSRILIEHQGELLMCCLVRTIFGRRSRTCKMFRANLEVLRWEVAEIRGPERLIISSYWKDFMPVSTCEVRTTRFVEIESGESLYNCPPPYREIMFSPRLW